MYELFLSFFFLLQMALSAATPILRGFLSDLDCRWCVIAGSVDDRTPEEMGTKVSLILLIKDFYSSIVVVFTSHRHKLDIVIATTPTKGFFMTKNRFLRACSFL